MNHYVAIKLKPSSGPITEPQALTQHFEATGSLMTALSGLLATDSGHTIALEFASHLQKLSIIVTGPEEWQPQLINLLYAAFPTAELEAQDHPPKLPDGELAAADVHFAPADKPIRNQDLSGGDPLATLLEVLSALPEGHHLSVKLVLGSTNGKPPLAARLLNGLGDLMLDSARHALSVPASESKDQNEPDDKDKAETAQLRANLRLFAVAPSSDAAAALVRRASGAYHGLAIPGETSVRYQPSRRPRTLLASAHRPDLATAFLLTPTEAANLFHPPLNPRAYPTLSSSTSTRLPIPTTLPEEGILLGHGDFRSSSRPIRLSPADRLRHTYLIGQTGTGKSTLFQSMFLQDMQNGDGCCFIDPHGEVIDWLLPRVPPHRAKDVILFDPSDAQALLGLNLLEWRSPEERDLIIQELIALFYKLFDPGHTGIIGPQFEHWLRNAALTVTEPQVRGTLVDIPRLFTDPGYQKAALARTQHPAARDFWDGQMASTSDFHKSEMLNYFTSKFGSFLGNSVMHQILSQPASAFDLRALMDRRKILLVNLSKGKLGSLNAQLLGTLIVTKIQMAALSRADIAAEHRAPFYVYIDEFQNLVTDSFASMLSEIRKYGVGLHLAHQYVDQLPEPIKQAVLGNVGTLMAFRLGTTDAKWLAPHFAPLTPDDLTGVPPYHYHLRTLAGGQLTTPFTVASPQIHVTPQPRLEQALRNRVRAFVAATSSTN
jgi:hypothetical protein